MKNKLATWFLGDKVSVLTHTYPHKIQRNIKIAICSHQVDSPIYLWTDVCSGDLKAKKRVWSYTTADVLTETRCQYTSSNSISYARIWWDFHSSPLQLRNSETEQRTLRGECGGYNYGYCTVTRLAEIVQWKQTNVQFTIITLSLLNLKLILVGTADFLAYMSYFNKPTLTYAHFIIEESSLY